jgi:hypothetical protein
MSDLCTQGAELKATHVVQSHRGLVERMFALLKNWGILTGGSVDKIRLREQELDIAMALHNLALRVRLGLLESIPKRARFAPDAHIITPELPPNLKIPKSVKVSDAKFPQHVRRFSDALSSIVPKLKKIVNKAEGFDIFTPRALQRAKNLWVAGNVLQIRVQECALGVWRVCFVVGASMKFQRYNCYADLSSNDGVVRQVCECKNGYDL